jgi:hypothetical protein
MTLSGLGRQMRDGVASAVSQTAAEALRQALASLLRESGEGPDALDDRRPFDDRPRLGDPSRPGIPLRADWGEPERLDDWPEPGESRWDRRDASDWRGHNTDVRDEYDQDDEHDRRDSIEPQQPGIGWRSVLAVGCRLVAWLLGRVAKPGRVLAALGVGLATALGIWLAGATPVTGSLTDALAAGISALAGLTG